MEKSPAAVIRVKQMGCVIQYYWAYDQASGGRIFFQAASAPMSTFIRDFYSPMSPPSPAAVTALKKYDMVQLLLPLAIEGCAIKHDLVQQNIDGVPTSA